MKPKGRRGEWFAIHEGRRLPCAHKVLTRVVDRQMEYYDPYVDLSSSKYTEFVEAIQQQKEVILTEDQLTFSGNADPVFNRIDYIALFKVDNVRVEDGVLRFNFVKRLDEF